MEPIKSRSLSRLVAVSGDKLTSHFKSPLRRRGPLIRPDAHEIRSQGEEDTTFAATTRPNRLVQNHVRIMAATDDSRVDDCVAAVADDLKPENRKLMQKKWDLARARGGYVILASKFPAATRPFGVALIAELVDESGPKTFVLDGLRGLLTDLAKEGLGAEAAAGNVRFRFLKRKAPMSTSCQGPERLTSQQSITTSLTLVGPEKPAADPTRGLGGRGSRVHGFRRRRVAENLERGGDT